MSKSVWRWRQGGEAAFRNKIDAHKMWHFRFEYKMGIPVIEVFDPEPSYGKAHWAYPCSEWTECVEQVVDLPVCKLCGIEPHVVSHGIRLVKCLNDSCHMAGAFTTDEWLKLMDDGK